ncbi:hypothetical protein H2204_008738 [Knufia peltigerae]|uniref:Uncharacterized protein n=1 Tax=Knufia peltigerae TaxID=1002370 RepID=A0AA38XZC1_9EURO|nr:hypothetical protein H2204_008738 [Knufia peltigerae]
MSGRRFIGWALVIGFGVLNGYTTFKPAFEDLELEKLKKRELDEASNFGPNVVEVSTTQNVGAAVAPHPSPVISQAAFKSSAGANTDG